MITTTAPRNASTANSVNVSDAHQAVISLFIMLGVLMVLVEVAGTSHQAAMGVLALMLAAAFLRGMSQPVALVNFANKYPWIP